MGKMLRFAALVLVMLLVSAIPAGADTEVKFVIPLTAVDPVTGEVTGDPDGRGKAEFTFDTEQGTVCYEIEVEGITEPVEPAPGLGSAHIHFLVHKPGFKTLVTQVFVDEDEHLETDVVFGVTRALVGGFERHEGPAPDGTEGEWYSLAHTFTMLPGESKLPRPPITGKAAGERPNLPVLTRV